MKIERLIWRPRNEAKLWEHGIDPEEVEDLVEQDNYTVDRRPEYPDQVRITGHTSRGRWLTIAMEDLGAGDYRPVTGWNATTQERKDFREKTQ